MTEYTYPPKKTLNFAIKMQMLQTLRRTDVYVVENDDPDNLLFSTQIRNFHDNILIQYDKDGDQGIHTLTYMGVVVAEMGLHVNMKITPQHQAILDVCKKIYDKAEQFKDLSNAKAAMTEEENLVYQRAVREAQNARYD